MAKHPNIRPRGRKWVVHFRVNGRQVWRTFDTREKAELFLYDVRIKKARGEYREPVKVTFGEALDEWLRHGEHERHLKPSTLRDYRSIIGAHLLPAFGDAYLEDLSAQRLER